MAPTQEFGCDHHERGLKAGGALKEHVGDEHDGGDQQQRHIFGPAQHEGIGEGLQEIGAGPGAGGRSERQEMEEDDQP